MKIRRRDGVPAPEGDVLVLEDDRASAPEVSSVSEAPPVPDGTAGDAGAPRRRRPARPPTAAAPTRRTGRQRERERERGAGRIGDARRSGVGDACEDQGPLGPAARQAWRGHRGADRSGARAAGGFGQAPRRDPRRHGRLDEQRLVEALADFFDMPVTHLAATPPTRRRWRSSPKSWPASISSSPSSIDGDGLHVAVAQPSDDLRFLLTRDQWSLGAAAARLRVSDIRWAIDRSYQAIGGVGKWCRRSRRWRAREAPPSKTGAAGVVTDDAPVVQVVDRILTQAIRDRASDVHIEPHGRHLRVRFRIDGALKDVLELPAPWASGWSAASRSWPA